MSKIINFDTEALWTKITDWSRKAGRITTRPVILLWYVMVSKDTPRSDKLLIFSALSYLVLPVDLIDAKRLPIIGWMDEVVSLTVVTKRFAAISRQKWSAKRTRCLTDGFQNTRHTN